MVRAYNMYCLLHLINVHIKQIQITIQLQYEHILIKSEYLEENSRKELFRIHV
jgi:hypothetical protein